MKCSGYEITRVRLRSDVGTHVRCLHFDPDGKVTQVPHLVRHSPDGFEFGYSGSGAADLARSIVGREMGLEDPPPVIYQGFNQAFIAPLEGDGPHWLDAHEVREWIAERRGDAP